MNKLVKIIFILIIISLLLIPKTYAFDSIIDDGNGFLDKGENNIINETKLHSVSNTIYNSFFIVAVGIMVIVGAFLGIKIMVGSIEEKAKIKEMLIPYVIGCVVIFSAFTIWSIVVKVGTNITGNISEETEEDELGTIEHEKWIIENWREEMCEGLNELESKLKLYWKVSQNAYGFYTQAIIDQIMPMVYESSNTLDEMINILLQYLNTLN